MADRDHTEADKALGAWERAAHETQWARPWTTLWQPDPPFDHWFVDGLLNVSVNCVDRHLGDKADDTAIFWEGEPGDRRRLTFAELHHDVVNLTGALRGMGLGPGGRVALHLGWLPETVTAMLACARIGAVYTIIPTPLPVEALIERIDHFAPTVLFTQDGAWRRGAILPLKARIDEALSAVPGVEVTVVVRRTGVDVPWYEGDRWYHDVVTDTRPGTPRTDGGAADLPSEHPLLVDALANRRGHPVSVTHAGARLLLSAAMVHRYGSCEQGVTWIASDASWLATQASGIYGPLFWGETTVMFEGGLDTPTHARTWEIVERYQVATLLLSPSAARMLREWSPAPPPHRMVASLRRFATLGERVDRSLLEWFAHDVGRGNVQVADGWGQVQLGGVIRFDAPVDAESLPDPGLRIVDASGDPVIGHETGEVVLTFPWAGMMLDVNGSAAEDVIDVHWNRYDGVYATGDLARYDDTGAFEFLGRRDEVVSVAGQLVSLTEVREVLQDHPYVVVADVFEVRHTMRKPSVMAAVVLDPELSTELDTVHITRELLDSVREVLGGLARPQRVLILDRFGDELTGRQRRSAFAVLAAASSSNGEASLVSWSQVIATAGVRQP